MTTFYGFNYNNMRNIGINDTFYPQQSTVDTKKCAKAEEIINCINGNFEKLLQIVIGSNDLYKKESEKNNKNMMNINSNFDFIFKSLKKLSSNLNERNLRMNELKETYQLNMLEKVKEYIGEQVNLLRFDLSLIYGDILKLFDEFANKNKNKNIILQPQHDINPFEFHDDAKHESELQFEYDVIQNALISGPKIDLEIAENRIDLKNKNSGKTISVPRQNKIKNSKQESKNKRKRKEKTSKDVKAKPPDKIIGKFVCSNAFIAPQFRRTRAPKDDRAAQEILDIVENNYDGFKIKCERFGYLSRKISQSLLLTSSGSIGIKWLERKIRRVAGQRVYWAMFENNAPKKRVEI